MALASARPDCLVSSSGADYRPGLGLVSHKPAASQPLIRVWLATNWWSVDKVLIKKPF